MRRQASQPSGLHNVASLRAITYRISSTPTKQLPHVASQIAASLWNVRNLLSAPHETIKSNSEAAALVNRLIKTLSTLLQDRTTEGRWSAVVLVKAAIEAGGTEVLGKSGAWVRSLLTILKKPDPPTTRILAVIALTRIFILTWDHSNLVREITTPALPAFIASCLHNILHERCSAHERHTSLEAFVTLIPRHPTVFRTHEAQIRALLVKILSSSPSTISSESHYTEDEIQIAQWFFVLLHHCASKQGGAQKWEDTLTSTVSAVHDTCDVLFRSVIENSHAISVQGRTRKTVSYSGEPESIGEVPLGFEAWIGIYAGGERLITLLGVLKSQIERPTSSAITLRVGVLIGVIHRLLSVTATTSSSEERLKINPEISKDEREALMAVLPAIHVATFDLTTVLLSRLGTSCASSVHALLEAVVSAFDAEKADVTVRVAAYNTVKHILKLFGSSLSKEDVADLASIARHCCDDLMDKFDPVSSQARMTSGGPKPQSSSNAETLTAGRPTVQTHPTQHESLCKSARDLLPLLFTKINPAHMPHNVRVQMERTAILTQHREALVACVLNPARKDDHTALQPSLLPLLARLYPESSELEALLRPRMPVAMSKTIREDFDAVGASENDLTDEDLVEDASVVGSMDDLEPSAEQLDNINGEDHITEPLEPSGGDVASGLSYPTQHLDTPENRVGVVSLEDSSVDVLKRQAAEPVESDLPAKRTRRSSVLQPLESQHETNMPSAATVEKGKQEREVAGTASTEKKPIPSSRILLKGSTTTHPREYEDEDDSDFEIPLINPDPDTDPDEDEDSDAEME